MNIKTNNFCNIENKVNLMSLHYTNILLLQIKRLRIIQNIQKVSKSI